MVGNGRAGVSADQLRSSASWLGCVPMPNIRRIAYATLRTICILHCYRRGNEVMLQNVNQGGVDRYVERDASTCANDAVQYGTALANGLWTSSKGDAK